MEGCGQLEKYFKSAKYKGSKIEPLYLVTYIKRCKQHPN